MANIEDLDKFARQSAERANEISSEYSKSTSLIIDKLIIISLGTSSLMFTFIGVLYSSSREVSDLEFKYILLSIISFVLSATLLLLARWFPSLFRHSMAQKYYLGDLKNVDDEKLKLLNNNQLINSRTGKPFTEKEAKAYRLKLENNIAKIEKGIARSKKDEKNYHRLYRYTFLAGILFMVVGYGLAMVFSMGIVTLLNK